MLRRSVELYMHVACTVLIENTQNVHVINSGSADIIRLAFVYISSSLLGSPSTSTSIRRTEVF